MFSYLLDYMLGAKNTKRVRHSVIHMEEAIPKGQPKE